MTRACVAVATYPGLNGECLAILYPKRHAVNLFRTLWLKFCTFRTKYLRTNANRPKFYVAGILSTQYKTRWFRVPVTA